MQCSLPPHQPLSFTTYADYEVHYAQVHTNRCSECRKNFPTEHFLNLHIGENHDPLNDALKAKGEKTYHCFVSDCDKVCSTPQKRRMHLIDKHLFPKNYDFFIVNDGIDKRSSMLRVRSTQHRRRSSAASRAMHRESHAQPPRSSVPIVAGIDERHEELSSSQSSKALPSASLEVLPDGPNDHGSPCRSQDEAPVDDVMESLTSELSSLKFIPPSVRFGRGGRRGGFAKS